MEGRQVRAVQTSTPATTNSTSMRRIKKDHRQKTTRDEKILLCRTFYLCNFAVGSAVCVLSLLIATGAPVIQTCELHTLHQLHPEAIKVEHSKGSSFRRRYCYQRFTQCRQSSRVSGSNSLNDNRRAAAGAAAAAAVAGGQHQHPHPQVLQPAEA